MDPVMPPAATRLKAHPLIPYLAVRCRDGQWMQITNQTDRMFRRWMTVLDLDFIWDDARWSGARFVFPDQEAKEALAKLILERMATKTFDEWMTIFLAEGLTGDRFLTTQQALDDPQVRHNGSVIEVVRPRAGPDTAAGDDGAFGVSPGRVKGPGAGDRPTLGALAPEAGVAAGADPAGSAAAGGRRRGPVVAPLAGLTVLEFASWLAGPYGTSLLADMGARVIKVESPTGDDGRWSLGGRSRTFQGKESLRHRSQAPRGTRRHGETAGPGRRPDAQHARRRRGPARHRLRIGARTQPRDRLSLCGSYGSTGPGAGRGAFHPTMGALSGGVLRQMGRGNEPPAGDVPLTATSVFAYSMALGPRKRGVTGHRRRPRRGHGMAMGFFHRLAPGRASTSETRCWPATSTYVRRTLSATSGKPEMPALDSDLRGTNRPSRPSLPNSGPAGYWSLARRKTSGIGSVRHVGRSDLAGQARFADTGARRLYRRPADR